MAQQFGRESPFRSFHVLCKINLGVDRRVEAEECRLLCLAPSLPRIVVSLIVVCRLERLSVDKSLNGEH